jgi:thiol-disulfide isomerase/thioredoxin
MLFETCYPLQKYSSVHDLQGRISSISKESVFDSLRNVIEYQTQPLKKLYLSGGIDYTYYQMATTSIRSAMLTEFLKPFIRKTSISKRFAENEVNGLLKKIFREYNPADPYYAIGVRSYGFIADYERYLMHDVLTNITLRNRMVDSLIEGDSLLLPIEDFIPYLLFEQDGFREHIWGTQLYLVKRLFPEEVPINDLRAFKHFYPTSSYLPFLAKLYERDLAINDSLSVEVIIVDSLARIDDFEILAQTIQDSSKLIFVDLWASWCIPCKEQFEFNQKLDTLLERYRISKVYVAIDQLFAKKSWLNDIKRYRLLGRHYIANDRFKLFLQLQVFKEGEEFSIPKYILLDRSGAILNSNLARPSSFGLLERQLRQYVMDD